MQDTPDQPLGTTTIALVATAGALGGWWWQSRAREKAIEERTRVRLRAWSMR